MSYALTILGGLGIFLLGMKLLSDNLRDAAGDALRVLLARFTRGRFSAVATGTIFTALVQSSSATTLASIGFVSAGLLTFTQAVGVIFGANLGTTATSWLVATIGFKVSISSFAYPMVGLGALASLLLRGRRAHIGAAVAGFGLIFVGIDVLQLGMADLADRIDLSAIGAEGFTGRLLLVAIGFIMTVLMQSSSAAIAATLTAVFAGAIDLPQAATLVIGQSVGTTATAALAAIGSTTAARRTAAAHIIFNVITATLALAALPLFLIAHRAWLDGGGVLADATAIAIFHTSFKVMGVAVLLPFIEPFSKLVYRIVPGSDPQYAAGLDHNAAAIPAIAVEATRNAQREIYAALVGYLTDILKGSAPPKPEELDAMAIGLTRCRDFLDLVRTDPDQATDHERHLAILHTLDHLERLCRRLDVAVSQIQSVTDHSALEPSKEILLKTIDIATTLSDESTVAGDLEGLSDSQAKERKRRRHRLLKDAASGDPSPRQLDQLLRALLWCDRVAFHLWRAAYYLEGGTFDPGVEPSEPLES